VGGEGGVVRRGALPGDGLVKAGHRGILRTRFFAPPGPSGVAPWRRASDL